MTIRPLPGKVLVEPDPIPERTASGLSLVHDVEPVQGIGTVRAVGRGDNSNDEHWWSPLAAGQRVLFATNAGYDIRTEGKTYVLLNHGDVVAVVE